MPARGRPKGSVVKPWQDAIRLAVNEKGKDGQKKLRKLATALVSAGMDGDVTALREIGDRLDGKSPQALVGDENNPVRVLAEIKRTIVDKAK